MNKEIQVINLSDFQDYLVNKGYSKHVIPIYIRKVKNFLDCKEMYLVSCKDYEELKMVISKYMASIPLTS